MSEVVKRMGGKREGYNRRKRSRGKGKRTDDRGGERGAVSPEVGQLINCLFSRHVESRSSGPTGVDFQEAFSPGKCFRRTLFSALERRIRRDSAQ